MSMDRLWPPAHIFLLESTDSLADRRFDFSLCLHGALGLAGIPNYLFGAIVSRFVRQNMVN
jgi:hypothetical protein